MNPISEIVRRASRRARSARAETFRSSFRLGPDTVVLDLGSEDGTNIASILAGTAVDPANVYIADIDPAAVERGERTHGFRPVLLGESDRLPFPDQFFDVVFCSSVIEHVTVPKERVWETTGDFAVLAAKRQRQFADEIRRIGRGYFVQTPSRTFPIESHSWLPGVGYLPRPVQIRVLRLTNRFWVKKTAPDFRLLDRGELAGLFPDAEIVAERNLGLVKSVMAVRSGPVG